MRWQELKRILRTKNIIAENQRLRLKVTNLDRQLKATEQILDNHLKIKEYDTYQWNPSEHELNQLAKDANTSVDLSKMGPRAVHRRATAAYLQVLKANRKRRNQTK